MDNSHRNRSEQSPALEIKQCVGDLGKSDYSNDLSKTLHRHKLYQMYCVQYAPFSSRCKSNQKTTALRYPDATVSKRTTVSRDDALLLPLSCIECLPCFSCKKNSKTRFGFVNTRCFSSDKRVARYELSL
jgi:hypothetical protein